MKSLTESLAGYRKSCEQKSLAYRYGTPAMILGLLILLSWVSISVAARWHITFAWLLVIATLAYYYFMDAKLAGATSVVMVFVTLMCTWIAFPAPTSLGILLFLLLFVGGCALHFMDGADKSKKGLFKIASQLLVAPVFFTVELLSKTGLDKQLGIGAAGVEGTTPPKEEE